MPSISAAWRNLPPRVGASYLHGLLLGEWSTSWSPRTARALTFARRRGLVGMPAEREHTQRVVPSGRRLRFS